MSLELNGASESHFLLPFQQHYHKKGLPLTDLHKFLAEQLESCDALERQRAAAPSSFSLFCCSKRCVCSF